MIDFVTKGEEVLILRDNKPYYNFLRNDIIKEHPLYLIGMLNSEARKYEDNEMNPTEEDQFMDLQSFVINLANKNV